MSWNNIQSRYGTATSALTLDDNELLLRVMPAAVGAAPTLDVLPYYEIDNRARTVAAGTTSLSFDRLPNSNVVRLTGTIAAGAEPGLLRSRSTIRHIMPHGVSRGCSRNGEFE
jgi:D-alanyl-D-alanine carboxypeptidase/D-alanyl-D-alanine-endopeptidase (penicillin-binding protein 4)